MCFSRDRGKPTKVSKVFNADGTISEESESNDLDLPGHADNPLLNTNVKTGILGFRYETKNSSLVVYSNVQCKTFCFIMQLTPLKN